jgi:hypothetical protein
MTKSLEFIVPSFFPKEQLFGMEISSVKRGKEIKEQIIFIKNGQKIIQNYEDPKEPAEKSCKKINLGGFPGPGIVRLTIKNSNLIAYVVINKNDSKQVHWAKTQKIKRVKKESKLGVPFSEKTESLIAKGRIAI